jgi:predicted dehydrogenase
LVPERVRQARELGLEAASDDDGDIVENAKRFSDGYGLDAVLITASTTSHDPLALAMEMSRRKGRVVVVGAIGLHIRREMVYAKELDLLMSTSYGPGRYDPSYEEQGLDYPHAYVRWTENRNMQAYLELIAAGRIVLAPLTARRLPVHRAPEAFKLLQEAKPRPYTVLLEYPSEIEQPAVRRVAVTKAMSAPSGTIRLAILGAGVFARNVHLPNLRKLADQFHIEAIVARHGPNAVALARQFGARIAATDYREVLSDPAIDAVLIATRHHLHAEMVHAALQAGKHVFVEKPLALSEDELKMMVQLVQELNASPAGCPAVYVGFNRRYSPYAIRLHNYIAARSTPLHVTYRMNAGYLPPEHWTHGTEGGGRILGEACHIFDLFRFLVGAPTVAVWATGIRAKQLDVSPTDNFTATLQYADGSVCTLLYTAQGGQGLPKEAMELHVDAQSFLLDDYRHLQGFGVKENFTTKKQDKGHYDELVAFHQTIAGKRDQKALWEEAIEVTRTAFEVDGLVRGN